MTTQYSKPLPQPDMETQGFWDGCKEHELRILRCDACATYVHFPAPICHNCNSMGLSWRAVSGKGKVFTFVVVHQSVTPGFADDIPYVVAWIELDEQAGLKMVSNIVDCAPSEVTIGMPVEVVFDDVTAEVTLPKFRPAS